MRFHVITTPTDHWYFLWKNDPAGDGRAEPGSFRRSGTGLAYSGTVPAWAFITNFSGTAITTSLLEIGGIASHEAGHGFALAHDGWRRPNGQQQRYFFGNGSGCGATINGVDARWGLGLPSWVVRRLAFSRNGPPAACRMILRAMMVHRDREAIGGKFLLMAFKEALNQVRRTPMTLPCLGLRARGQTTSECEPPNRVGVLIMALPVAMPRRWSGPGTLLRPMASSGAPPAGPSTRTDFVSLCPPQGP